MGIAVHRDADLTTGHGCPPPADHCGSAPQTVPQTYSSDVFAGGKGIVRNGDTITPHACSTCFQSDPVPCQSGCPTHTGSYTATSTNVYVNGKLIVRVGDSVTCTDAAGTGSGTVFAG